MTFYVEMAEVAAELLSEFRQGEISLAKPGTETPGPNPWGPPVMSPPAVYTLDATAKPVSEHLINGTTIVATDTEIVAAVFGADPDPTDHMEIDGRAVTIIKVMRLPAAGQVVAWRIIVRG